MLKGKEYEYYLLICKLTETELLEWLRDFVVAHGYTKYSHTDEYLIAEGDIDVVLLAHCDTVWKTPPTEIYYDREQQAMWSPDAGTGDDRAGVFGIVKLIIDGYKPHVIFTTGEERGGIVSAKLAEYKNPFPQAKYLVQLDRQGRNDCVFYSSGNEEFVKYVESFGFETHIGSFTDVENLGEPWGLSYCNLSIGYVREHSISEVVHVDWMLETIDKVKAMLNDLSNVNKFGYIKKAQSYSWNMPQSFNDIAFPAEYDYTEDICDLCGNIYPIEELIDMQDRDGKRILCCSDCASKVNIGYCKECADFYLQPKESNEELCPICIREKNGGTSCYLKKLNQA